jgi:hypothetical protein
VAGCVFLGIDQARDLDFVGSPAQFVVSSLAILGLVVAGVALGRHGLPLRFRHASRAPRPVVVGFAAFVVTSGYWLSNGLPTHGVWGVLATVACFAVAACGGGYLVVRWSRSPAWDGRHRLALAPGAAATYATWFGLVQAGEAGTGPVEAAWGAAVFGLAVTALVVAAARRQVRLAGVPAGRHSVG